MKLIVLFLLPLALYGLLILYITVADRFKKNKIPKSEEASAADEHDLDLADEIMTERCNKPRADRFLQKILKRKSANEGVYSYAFSIYYVGEMYEEAKNVYEMFEKKYGRKLYVGEDGEADLVNELAIDKKTRLIKSKSMGMWSFRAHYPWLSIIPGYYREVLVSKNGITVNSMWSQVSYKWDECKPALFWMTKNKYQETRHISFEAGRKKYHFTDRGFKDNDLMFDEVLPNYLKIKRKNRRHFRLKKMFA